MSNVLDQKGLDEIKKSVVEVTVGLGGASAIELPLTEYTALVNAAQAFVDTKDHVVISKAEYDYLIERDFRLKDLEV